MRSALAVLSLLALAVAVPVQAGLDPSPFLDFFPTETQTSGPPYPTTPIEFEVQVLPTPGTPAVEVEVLKLSVIDAKGQIPPDDQFPIEMEGSIVFSDQIGAPTKAKAVLSMPPDDIFDPGFKLLVELAPLGGSNPRLGSPPDDIFDPGTPTFFDVFFDIEVDEGVASHTMRFQIDADQPNLRFAEVVVGEPQSPAFEVSFRVVDDGGGPVPPGPVFEVITSGTFGDRAALVDVAPDTLNVNSNGRWVTAYITLPEGFDPAAIDPATVAITGLDGLSCDPDYVQPIDPAFTPTVGDYDEDGFLDLTVKFDRQLLSANLCLDDVAIRIEGDLVSGEHFVGEDLIRVIQRGQP